jgi:hypothetical protein
MSSTDEVYTPSKKIIWQGGKLWSAFKSVAIVFSFTVNLVLIIVLLIIVRSVLFPTKTEVVEPLLDNLQGAVNALERATIIRTISIDERVPVNFTLPLDQPTTVVLSQDVELVRPATFYLPGGGGVINGTVALNLPTGLQLPILLDMDIPVNNIIPVQFPVEVSIPLNETELRQVVVELNNTLGPIRRFVDGLRDGF